jgi:hypothetical protein
MSPPLQSPTQFLTDGNMGEREREIRARKRELEEGLERG